MNVIAPERREVDQRYCARPFRVGFPVGPEAPRLARAASARVRIPMLQGTIPMTFAKTLCVAIATPLIASLSSEPGVLTTDGSATPSPRLLSESAMPRRLPSSR